MKPPLLTIFLSWLACTFPTAASDTRSRVETATINRDGIGYLTIQHWNIGDNIHYLVAGPSDHAGYPWAWSLELYVRLNDGTDWIKLEPLFRSCGFGTPEPFWVCATPTEDPVIDELENGILGNVYHLNYSNDTRDKSVRLSAVVDFSELSRNPTGLLNSATDFRIRYPVFGFDSSTNSFVEEFFVATDPFEFKAELPRDREKRNEPSEIDEMVK